VLNENSRDDLIKAIERKLKGTRSVEFKARVQQLLTTNDKYDATYYSKLVLGILSLNQIPNEELLWFAQAMEQAGLELHIPSIIVSDYFTEIEIKNYKYYKRNKVDVDELLTLKNVLKLSISDEIYQGAISFKQLALLRKDNLVRVIPEVQRQTKERKFGETILQEIQTYPIKIKEIKKAILDNKYFPDEIVINLMNDGEHYPIIDLENHIIKLPEDGDLIITDGNNRSIAVEMAYSESPESEEYLSQTYFPITFTNFDVDGAKSYLDQKWKATPVRKAHRESMSRTKANEVTDSILHSPDLYKEYKKVVYTTMQEIKLGHGYILYSVLSNAIEDNYNVSGFKSPKESKELISWIVEFCNELYDNLFEDFNEYKTVRSSKWSVNPYAWVGYIYLSKQLRDKENWQTMLKKILHTINFDKSFFEELTIVGLKPEKFVKKYFEERWVEYGHQK
jgi:hypothetical protein